MGWMLWVVKIIYWGVACGPCYPFIRLQALGAGRYPLLSLTRSPFFFLLLILRVLPWAYSLLKLFTGLVKAALMVCKTMRKAVMNVSRAMEAMKGRNEISIL